jgi:hypothetical protein
MHKYLDIANYRNGDKLVQSKLVPILSALTFQTEQARSLSAFYSSRAVSAPS